MIVEFESFDDFDELDALCFEMKYAGPGDSFWDGFADNYSFEEYPDIKMVAKAMKKELYDRAHARYIDRNIHPEDRNIIE